jgi:hypothetical protein
MRREGGKGYQRREKDMRRNKTQEKDYRKEERKLRGMIILMRKER